MSIVIPKNIHSIIHNEEILDDVYERIDFCIYFRISFV